MDKLAYVYLNVQWSNLFPPKSFGYILRTFHWMSARSFNRNSNDFNRILIYTSAHYSQNVRIFSDAMIKTILLLY